EKVLSRIVEKEHTDHIIHCGDFCLEAEDLPAREKMTVVRGNCDYADGPAEAMWEGSGYRFLVIHGHRYRVKSSLMPLAYRAEEIGADIVCFGHSHYPYCDIHRGRLFVNPGSVVQPRGYPVPTYVILETRANERVHTTYFTLQGRKVAELGGDYFLRPKNL